MSDELKMQYTVSPEITELNAEGYLKPNGYQVLLNRIAEKHLNAVNLNEDTIMEKGFAWVLISMKIDIEKPISGCAPLICTTWHSQRKGPYFRREIQIKNSDGEIMVNCTTMSVLLDMSNRTIYRKKELPFQLCEETPVYITEASAAFREKLEYMPVETRRVRRSTIDCLGHVNNCRYGEYAYDALNNDEADMTKIKSMEIYFISEMHIDDEFTVEKYTDGNNIYIQGSNKTKNDIAFKYNFIFK